MKINKLIDDLVENLNRCKIDDLNLHDVKTIKNDLQTIKEKIENLEKVIDAFILTMEE